MTNGKQRENKAKGRGMIQVGRYPGIIQSTLYREKGWPMGGRGGFERCHFAPGNRQIRGMSEASNAKVG